ncbi:hypothetical protein Q5P01_005265 [Channa striata]|uniref:Uncharacterized protein n=1 Tax=Channa striata TaxID=64152 RepID=A0AA88NNF6_CHASR|nr:hypothetical protein Q5P01_005265 [Channa striata]
MEGRRSSLTHTPEAGPEVRGLCLQSGSVEAELTQRVTDTAAKLPVRPVRHTRRTDNRLHIISICGCDRYLLGTLISVLAGKGRV